MKLKKFWKEVLSRAPIFVCRVKFETRRGFTSGCVVVRNFSDLLITPKEAELQPKHYTQVQDVHTVDGKAEPG